MNSMQRVILLIIFLFAESGAAAQIYSTDVTKVYSSDPLLYNGRYYTFFPPLSTGGNQFLADRQFEVGSVTIRGVTYPDLLLNYDIYNQQLVLKYKNKAGGTDQIIVSDAWLESFSFRSKNFEMISIQDTVKRIFQVLGKGQNRIFYYWKKDLNVDNLNGAKNHIFSVARKEMNIFNGKQILKYGNNKSFYSLFKPEKRNVVKKYLHEHNINVKKAADQEITELLYFCNNLYEK